MDETVLDQFGFKRFSVRSQPKDKGTVVAPPPVGCCEFVGDPVDSVDGGHYCFDKTFCPKRFFADEKVYANCPTRIEKLKAKTGQL
jgi:hypothetical protein